MAGDSEKINSLTDQGESFGKWTDKVSRFMYHDHFASIYKNFALQKYVTIEDLGGANGLLAEFFESQSFSTADIDESKNPDFIGNIINYNSKYKVKWRGQTLEKSYQSDLLIIRFVLHYMTDEEILLMFNNIQKHHKGDILIVQFTNEGPDMQIKRQNSINEVKIFRTSVELIDLLQGFDIIQQHCQSYNVTEEFYRNRLNNYDAQPHGEIINSFLIRSRPSANQ
jgi:hypothetical protein